MLAGEAIGGVDVAGATVYIRYTMVYGLLAGLGVSTSRIRIHGPGPLPPMGPRLAHLWHLSRAGTVYSVDCVCMELVFSLVP